MLNVVGVDWALFGTKRRLLGMKYGHGITAANRRDGAREPVREDGVAVEDAG
jgi:hypothetical protein